MTNSIYQQITETIIGHLLTAKPQSWERPWHRGHSSLPVNAATRRAYHGINILTLWAAAIQAGYTDPRWATYRQWSELGAKVRKGERSSLCIFYKPSGEAGDRNASSAPEDPTAVDKPRFVLRVSSLFNTAQVDGAPEPWLAPAPMSDIPACSIFDAFIAAAGANVLHGGDTACYLPAADQICMPTRQSFKTPPGYTATLSHELIHWTGAKHRLDRDLSGRFGSASYAAEELVAELGAAFVLASLGLASEPPPQHAAYIISWLPLVKSDPRALFTAATHASRAADWLRERVSIQTPNPRPEEGAFLAAQTSNCTEAFVAPRKVGASQTQSAEVSEDPKWTPQHLESHLCPPLRPISMSAANGTQAQVPCIGIFWSIPDGMNHHALVIDSTSLTEAETYGEFLTHPRGHYDVWENWRRLGPVGLAGAGLPAAILWHEYEDFPRGRIVYHREVERFIIYADRRLQTAAFIRRVAIAFGLPPTKIDVRSDAHYRTERAG